jgi:type II secretory pathway pseudopilin PulG
MKLREKYSQKGFTMPELLVVGGVFTILVIVSAMLIHPADYSAERRDAERMVGTAQLMQAFNRYVAEHNALPQGLTDEQKTLGSEEGMLDYCPELVPKYIKDLPWDPLGGGSFNEVMCHPEDPYYTTGYAIRLKGSALTIEAPATEFEEKISITRTYPSNVLSASNDEHEHEH